jgi:hypothetical protein
MITSEMPYKLREIIMDTWPQLYWLKDAKNRDIKTKLCNRELPKEL